MKANVGGIEVGYDDRGRGPAIVLIHGFPFSRRMWERQTPALSASHRVIAPDLRGFGESGGTPSSVEELADDVRRLVEHLDLPQFVLAGFSMGGYVAFRYLARHADRVRAVMLLDTRAEADTPEGRARRYTAIDKITKDGPQGFLDDFLKLVVSPRTMEARPEIVAEVRGLMEARRVASLTGGLKVLAERPDSTPLLAKIAVPTLIVVGEEDKATPVDSARAMQSAIAGSTLVVIPGAGHVSNIEQSEQFNAALVGFLGGL